MIIGILVIILSMLVTILGILVTTLRMSTKLAYIAIVIYVRSVMAVGMSS